MYGVKLRSGLLSENSLCDLVFCAGGKSPRIVLVTIANTKSLRKEPGAEVRL